MQRVIFRVENDNGTGMYIGTYGFTAQEYSESMAWGARRHPNPSEDYGLRSKWSELREHNTYEQYSFGFSSIEQMRSWVSTNEWREELHAHGFMINMYLADDSHIGDTQAIFHKGRAVKVGTISLNTLH